MIASHPANPKRECVLQDWVLSLSFMQQSVLLTVIRGPDAVSGSHVAKTILRWYRRCILKMAFGHFVAPTVDFKGGGSFTGPLSLSPYGTIEEAVNVYFKSVDGLPHHFQMHLMHAAQIIGEHHPDNIEEDAIKKSFWQRFYSRYVQSLHLCPETRESMDKRLGDDVSTWLSADCEKL